MGFFSWKTCDTDRSIANVFSNRDVFEVHMITEDGRIFTESDYQGYGEFGGKDFYELLAELNGLENDDKEQLRLDGITLSFKDNPSGDYNGNFKMPKLVQNLPKENENWQEFWDNLIYPKSCEYQGYFYDSEDDE